MNYEQSYITSEIEQYSKSLMDFLNKTNLQELVLPIDHFAFRLTGRQDFEKFMEFLIPLSQSLQYIERDGRRIGTAKLLEPVDFNAFGKPSYIEFKESKPETLGREMIGLDHTEILVESTEAFVQKLESLDIAYELQTGPFHRAIVVKFNSEGQEFKITTQKLSEIIAQETAAGNITKIK